MPRRGMHACEWACLHGKNAVEAHFTVSSSISILVASDALNWLTVAASLLVSRDATARSTLLDGGWKGAASAYQAHVESLDQTHR